jgi:hypothetical protein
MAARMALLMRRARRRRVEKTAIRRHAEIGRLICVQLPSF